MRSDGYRTRWFWSRLPSRQQLITALGLGSVLLLGATTGIATAQQADLTGSWSKLRQGCNLSDPPCKLKGKFSQQNQGTAAAPSSTLGIYLSVNNTFGGGDILVDAITASALAAGEMTTIKVNIQYTQVNNAFGIFVLGVIDDGGQVPESDETNNVIVLSSPGPPAAIIDQRTFKPNPPGNVTITVGQRVRWIYQDTDLDQHTVTSGLCPPCTGNGLFDSGAQDADLIDTPGETFEFVFTTPGVFLYFCREHEEQMIGTITVVSP